MEGAGAVVAVDPAAVGCTLWEVAVSAIVVSVVLVVVCEDTAFCVDSCEADATVVGAKDICVSAGVVCGDIAVIKGDADVLSDWTCVVLGV